MAYSRRQVTDGLTVMNKDLYDNLQDGIEECKEALENLVLEATIEEVATVEE